MDREAKELLWQTGVYKTKKEYDPFTRYLKNEATEEECIRFSGLVFKLSNNFDEVQESKQRLKQEAQKLRDLEKGNEIGFLKYLEHWILSRHHEFIIPYYLISKEIGKPIDDKISNRDNYFGTLGQLSKILD